MVRALGRGSDNLTLFQPTLVTPWFNKFLLFIDPIDLFSS